MPNYILIGMPSSGKTTKGRRLAQIFGLDFLDTDHLITDKTGQTPAQIVKDKGRDAFVSIQDDIIGSYVFNNSVIATGGGIIYSENAMDNLKKTGTIIFLDVPFETLKNRIDSSRSLSSKNKSGLKEIYDERKPIYESFADIRIICDNKEANEIVEEIIKNIEMEKQI